MSWTLSINGHQPNEDHEVLEAAVKAAARLLRDADVGMTYVSLSSPHGQKAYFSSSTELDELAELTETTEPTGEDEEE